MTLSIVLNEDDLRAMPGETRDALLKWYFDVGRRRAPTAAVPVPPAPVTTTNGDESQRVTFAKLVAAGLLNTGEEIHCRTLKRQQRDGKPKYVKGARVNGHGTVDFGGQAYSNASNLAVAMVKQSGGKPTALNGFDYLFVNSDKTLVPLKRLRDRLMRFRVILEGAVEDAKTHGNETTAGDHEPWLRKHL